MSKTGGSTSTYTPAYPPPQPELISRHDPTPARVAATASEHDNVRDFRDRLRREVNEASPSIIPGIPETYVYKAQSVPLYSPNDVWKFRHLKPLQRWHEYLKLRVFCENLELFSSDEQMSQNILTSVRAKSAQLQYAECNFY